MRSPTSIAFLLAAALVQAQADLDSLRTVAADGTRPDSARFAAFYDLVWDGHLFTDPDTARIMGEWLQREARRKNNPLFEARASELIAASFYVRGDMRMALIHYDTALALHRRDHNDEGYADVVTNVATMRSYLGEHDTALVMYREGLAIHERIHDSTSIANDLNAIGRIHMLRGDHTRAVDHYMRSLRILERLGDRRGISTAHANMGALYLNQGDWPAALEQYRRALQLAEELDDRHMMGKDLEEIGSCLEEMGDTAAAMHELRRSETLRIGIGDLHGLVNVKNRIASLLLKGARQQQALTLFSESAAIARAEELPWGLGNALVGRAKALLALGETATALAVAMQADSAAREAEEMNLRRDAYEVRYNALRALGKWREALEAHEQVVLLNDSVMREENQRAVLRNEFRSAYERAAETDSLRHAAETTRAEAQHREQRLWLIALLALVAVLGAAAWLRMRYVARAKRQLEQKQAELVESERAREANEVRVRIARDVHDQLGSDLTKLVLLGTEVKEVAGTSTGELSSIASDIERIAGEANRSLGDIVWAIDPHHDSLAGLTDRVRAHCERMLKWSKVAHTIDCVHQGPDRSLDPATKRDIYLTLREALNNAIKYAKAQHIHVRFLSSAAQVEFEVKDDGVGMGATPGGGLGLGNMRARAARIGGHFEVVSAPNAGTSIRFQAALPTA